MKTRELTRILKTEVYPTHAGVLEDIAADIHAHPEIRFTEFHAAARLTKELEDHGFSVQRGFANLDTAFVGRWSSSSATSESPTVAVFCEYDALEGIGHGCGHNVIAAAGMGASFLIKDFLETNQFTDGHLVVVGSPGEEGAAGKVPMIEAGILDGVDCAIMVHPGCENKVLAPTMARVALDIDFTGRAAHAAGKPHEGVNALDASTLALNAIGLLRQQMTDDVRIHSIIVDGGQAPNIIPEYSSIRCLVRADDNQHLRSTVLPRVENCFRGAGLATGCEVSIRQNTPAYLAVETNSVLAQFAEEAYSELGREIYKPFKRYGSTDMGNVSQVVPAIHPVIELTSEANPHTHEFAAAAGSQEANSTIADGAVMLAATALSVFSEPSILTRLQESFSGSGVGSVPLS